MNILIVYFSRTYATRIIVEQIQELLEEKHKVELLKISEKIKYHFLKFTFAPIRNMEASSVLGTPRLYYDTFRKKKPKLEEFNVDFKKYDIIFIGSPIWYGRLPPAMNTFLDYLKRNISSFKTFVFITSGRGKNYENYSDVLVKATEESGGDIIGKIHKTSGQFLTKNELKYILEKI